MHAHLERMYAVLEGGDDLVILPHNDPDPDAIAGALALQHLATERLARRARVVYQGIIGRAENKALVRYLGHPLRRLVAADLSQSTQLALVDTQPGTGNNGVPPRHPVAIVIDHHPLQAATADAAFSDVRPDVGSTSTILTEYLMAAELEPPPTLATALFYGIKTDTMGLARLASPADATAYFYLQPRIDVEALVEIERAQVPAKYFKSFAATLNAARIYENAVISYLGMMDYPDLAAEMADLLMRLEGSQWVICMGVNKGKLILAVRTRSRRGGAGGLIQSIVGDRGSAGGHGTMAGGEIPLQGQDPEALSQRLRQRALEALRIPRDLPGRALIE